MPTDTPPHPLSSRQERSGGEGPAVPLHPQPKQSNYPLHATSNCPPDTPTPNFVIQSEAEGSIPILVIQLPAKVFCRRHTHELNHAQGIGGDLSATVVANLALIGACYDQNLGNIVHTFHLGD